MTTILMLVLVGQLPEYPVTQVLSGEVIVIWWQNRATPIRLHDVEAPTAAARDQLRALLDGEAVRLVYASRGPYDHAGRISAYIYRTSDNLMVNEDLIRHGYAGVSAESGDYAPQFRRLYRAARANHDGLWEGGHPLDSDPPSKSANETWASTLRLRKQHRRALHAAALERERRAYLRWKYEQ
jgi:endonuclease YncB( thermonuclease family)